MKYRPEIDGLRAVAVVPVIFFHAGFEAFSGGFVGVDVFLVISGYLITSIIISEQERGSFSIAGFYERRARRILPALFVVMAACVPFAWTWFLPPDMKDFAKSLIAVSLFGSNFLFWQQSNYFATASELKPLLHTWSLAVEEQYYLLFPAFMVLMWSAGRRWIARLLVLVAALSLVAAYWGATNAPVLSFFLLPARGWELLLGSFAAFYLARARSTEPSAMIREILGVAGLALILLSVVLFDRNTPFPSVYALLPTVGTVLLIVFATPATFIGTLLGSRILVALGLISYSAYLWHQPLFAFARNRSVQSPSVALMLALTGLALVLAYLSWRYVELPFRNRENFTRRQVFLLGAFASALFVATGTAVLATDLHASRLTSAQREVLAYEVYDFGQLYRAGTCFLDENHEVGAFSDACAPPKDGNGAVVWGDSHAAALSVGLREHIPDLGQYTLSGCPPIVDGVVSWRPTCKDMNDFVLQRIKERSPRRIFLHARWDSYVGSAGSSNLGRTLVALKRALPNAEIVVVGQVPYWKPSLPALMARLRAPLQEGVFLGLAGYEKQVAADAALGSLAARHGVRFKSALTALCKGDRCQATTNRLGQTTPMAWDNAHLTHAGSLVLAEKLLER